MTGVLIKNGRVIDPAHGIDATLDVLVSNGRVLSVGPALEARSERVVDASGAWVLPGFVDLHSVLRDDADVYAALRGGFTTVMTLPGTVAPETNLIRVLRAAPLTRELEGLELGEVPPGTRVVSQGFRPIERGGVLRRALQYLKPLDVLAMVHAEDPSLVAGGVLGESETATRLGIPAVPASAETSVVARD